MKSLFLSLFLSLWRRDWWCVCGGEGWFIIIVLREIWRKVRLRSRRERWEKSRKNKSNEGRRRRRRKTISWSRHKKTVVYPVLRRRNRGNATLISWSLFLRVLQGRATICQPPRPGGTFGFIIIILSRFCGVLFLLPSRFSGKNSVF